MEYREIVRKARTERGMTQGRLAELAGVDRTTVVRLEREGKATIATLEAISEVLDLTLTKDESKVTF